MGAGTSEESQRGHCLTLYLAAVGLKNKFSPRPRTALRGDRPRNVISPWTFQMWRRLRRACVERDAPSACASRPAGVAHSADLACDERSTDIVQFGPFSPRPRDSRTAADSRRNHLARHVSTTSRLHDRSTVSIGNDRTVGHCLHRYNSPTSHR